ncbi:hypothetical protein PIB30_025443 [Stylosanthes scabra]|uniref:RING-type E3 ubiquitin transferase n=1 Tax=Stylosanthes scabra TaxID=79078 RepID=A0ABU6U907_9FABA|nr:hypothetical protein [Stylosanthes scabra]
MDKMIASEMDQHRQGYFHSEPSILPRGTGISHPNIRTIVAASGSTSNHDPHYLPPDAYDNGVYVTQYNGVEPQHNRNMGVAATPNLYYSGMNPSSSTGVFPMPLNHRGSDQLPGSGAYAVSLVSSDHFGRSSSFVDDVRGPYKRKSAEGMRGNYQYFNAPASSSTAPPNAGHADGVPVMDAASFPLRVPSFVEVGPHGNAWSRSGDSIMVHDHNHLIRGNYVGQHFQPAAPPWLDQQLNSNNSDGHTTPWNQSLPMPYMHAPNVNGGSIESASMGLPRYHETASNRNGLRFPHPPPVNHQHHNYHHPALPMQGVRGHGVNFHPPVTAASFRVPANPSRGAAIPTPNGFEMAPRHVGPDVALIDEVGNLVDHHRDMRLDIEDMSYEDLLALGERIGNVSTGLSEETIGIQLKTKTYSKSVSATISDEATPEDREADSCIICQDEYKNKEKIGILRCEHEYHAECLRKWLIVKNVCPICKSEALTPGGKDV